MQYINKFSGRFRFLGNFYVDDITVWGLTWKTVEHLFQALKTSDPEQKEWIRSADKPGTAKKRGSLVDARPDWEDVKYDAMLFCLWHKFTKNRMLGTMLMDTAPKYLIEGNHWHDNTWGDCYCPSCSNIPGRNWLGLALMETRAKLMMAAKKRMPPAGAKKENVYAHPF